MAQQFIHEAHGDIGQAKDAFEAFVTNLNKLFKQRK